MLTPPEKEFQLGLQFLLQSGSLVLVSLEDSNNFFDDYDDDDDDN